MLTHTDIWTALDRLAQQHGLTASGLARRAGLDPTTFNKSKRETREGKPRWPSTESIAKVLEATSTNFSTFVSLLESDAEASLIPQGVPVMTSRQICELFPFDEGGRRLTAGWDSIPHPHLTDPDSYAVEVIGSDFAPDYPDGTILLLSPHAQARRHDRLMLITQDNRLLLCRLHRQSLRQLEVVRLRGEAIDVIPLTQIRHCARIIWASQ